MTRIVSEFDARMEMKAFIDRARAPYKDWYADVTADADERIEEHGLREDDWWIVRQLAKAEAALRVHESLLKLGCDGPPAEGAPGGDEAATSVYAYWKRGHTEP